MPQPNQVRPPGEPEGNTKDHAGSEVNESLPLADIAPAYIVVLVTPRGKTLRKPYLSLHSAQQALRRAGERGQQAWLILCKLQPVQADLDLGGEWSA
jgi:hypothetical protein